MPTVISTVPNEVNYQLFQGDTWQPGTITCTISGTPVSFTGWSAKMEIRNAISGEVVYTLTNGSGITLASGGVITFTLSAAQTNAMAGEYKYDLQMTKADGSIQTFIYGVISVVTDNTANS